jgi:hypothetical protein
MQPEQQTARHREMQCEIGETKRSDQPGDGHRRVLDGPFDEDVERSFE